MSFEINTNENFVTIALPPESKKKDEEKINSIFNNFLKDWKPVILEEKKFKSQWVRKADRTAPQMQKALMDAFVKEGEEIEKKYAAMYEVVDAKIEALQKKIEMLNPPANTSVLTIDMQIHYDSIEDRLTRLNQKLTKEQDYRDSMQEAQNKLLVRRSQELNKKLQVNELPNPDVKGTQKIQEKKDRVIARYAAELVKCGYSAQEAQEALAQAGLDMEKT